MALDHIQRRADRIRERREELDLTQEQVADLMHVAQRELNPDEPDDRTRGQMVSDWERAVNSPSPAKLELLAIALTTTVADLSAGPKDQRDADKTPSLIETMEGDPSQLDRIEGKLNILLSGLRLIPTANGGTLLDDATAALGPEPPEPPPDEEDEEPGSTDIG